MSVISLYSDPALLLLGFSFPTHWKSSPRPLSLLNIKRNSFHMLMVIARILLVERDNLLLKYYLNKLCDEKDFLFEDDYNGILLFESHFTQKEEIGVNDFMVLNVPMSVDYPPLWRVALMELDAIMTIDGKPVSLFIDVFSCCSIYI
ncbi:hypothetical protein BDB01DRAFT_835303 [Pilobolus umbonatus]|nr:hypothetical protein BDB01DRAFT_835303 [Pilobolus umbonatus]